MCRSIGRERSGVDLASRWACTGVRCSCAWIDWVSTAVCQSLGSPVGKPNLFTVSASSDDLQ